MYKKKRAVSIALLSALVLVILIVRIFALKDRADSAGPDGQPAYIATISTSEQAKVNLYYTEDFSAISEEDVSIAYARDAQTGGIDTSGEGQIWFSVIPEEWYGVQSVGISGNYEEFLIPEDTGIEETYGITGITGNLKISVHTDLVELPIENESSFPDVGVKDFFYEAVLWAEENDIVNVSTDETFRPYQECTRWELVDFLWSAEGRPEPTGTDSPFVDVTDESYCKAVLYAAENGITSGRTKTTFAPEEICTRGQVVTMLWNLAGKPEPILTELPFTDVEEEMYYYKAICWALERGIAEKITETSFQPDGNCTRAQVLVMLYNFKSSSKNRD